MAYPIGDDQCGFPPVAVSLMVTPALGIAAPEGSLMSPTSCPVDAVWSVRYRDSAGESGEHKEGAYRNVKIRFIVPP